MGKREIGLLQVLAAVVLHTLALRTLECFVLLPVFHAALVVNSPTFPAFHNQFELESKQNLLLSGLIVKHVPDLSYKVHSSGPCPCKFHTAE